MSRFCLDTSAYSQFKRGDASVVEILDRAEWIGVPVITLGKLRTGFLMGRRRSRHEEELKEFLANPVVQVVELDDDMHVCDVNVPDNRSGLRLPPRMPEWVRPRPCSHWSTRCCCGHTRTRTLGGCW